MKKIILYTLVLISTAAFAQRPVANFPHPQSVLQQELKQQGNARHIARPVPTPRMAAEAELTPAPVAHAASQTTVSYANPVGTLFLGVDEAGKGAWFTNNGVIGAWSDTIPCWIWPNTTTGAYADITYVTNLGYKYPSYVEEELYGKTADGSFTDSIVSSGGWADTYAMGVNGDEAYTTQYDYYWWQRSVPYQTVERLDGTKESFQLLKAERNYSPSDCPLAAGGLPSGATTDGLWPLTQAEPIQRDGVSMDLFDEPDEDEYVHYLFGSDSITIGRLQEEGLPTVYQREAPVKIVTCYERPQAPLYIKSVTLALGANGYDVAHKNRLVVNELYLEIQDMRGNVLAQSVATAANKSNLTYSKHLGQMLTFNFRRESDYGELLEEGLIVKDSFQIVITGFQPSDEFGIYAAKANTHASNAYMEYENGFVKHIDYEPYIMLNGIYPTWENYLNIRAFEKEGLITGVHGDTIDINFVSASSPYYNYIAHYAGEDLAGAAYFAFYSTFVPYDSITNLWTLDIEMPDYITIGADYTYNVSDDDDPVTLWDYLRIFEMWVYALDTPQIGDCIKLGKAGRYTVLRVTQIDGATAIPSIRTKESSSKAQKVLYNGSLYILKDGRRYSVLGQ